MAEIETTTGGNLTGSKIKALIDIAKKVKVVTDFSVEALAEIEEADASIKKLHQEYFYTVNSWAYRQSTRMGKPASELKQSDISFAEFFKTQGLSVDQYTQLSMEFAELSFDISTKYGLSLENANELLKAAVQREEYALKFLNINLKNSSLNGFSDKESIQNVANIILKETSGIRGSTEQDIMGYIDVKAMAVEGTKEVLGRTVGVVFEPLYTDLLNAYNDQINQAKLSLQIHSEKKSMILYEIKK